MAAEQRRAPRRAGALPVSETAATGRAGPHPLFVLEATGGYELLCVAVLATAGFPVVEVDPRQVRDIAKATDQLVKTDRVDAGSSSRCSWPSGTARVRRSGARSASCNPQPGRRVR